MTLCTVLCISLVSMLAWWHRINCICCCNLLIDKLRRSSVDYEYKSVFSLIPIHNQLIINFADFLFLLWVDRILATFQDSCCLTPTQDNIIETQKSQIVGLFTHQGLQYHLHHSFLYISMLYHFGQSVRLAILSCRHDGALRKGTAVVWCCRQGARVNRLPPTEEVQEETQRLAWPGQALSVLTQTQGLEQVPPSCAAAT